MSFPRRRVIRRRVFRVKAKWSPDIHGRRLKKLGVIPKINPPDEWAWEWEVLELVEKDAFTYLQAQGVPNSEWPYYIAYLKRLWNRCIYFGTATFQLEKQSLLNEFVLRGLNLTHLQNLQTIAEDYAKMKVGYEDTFPWEVGGVAEGYGGLSNNKGGVVEGYAGLSHNRGGVAEGDAGVSHNRGGVAKGYAGISSSVGGVCL